MIKFKTNSIKWKRIEKSSTQMNEENYSIKALVSNNICVKF